MFPPVPVAFISEGVRSKHWSYIVMTAIGCYEPTSCGGRIRLPLGNSVLHLSRQHITIRSGPTIKPTEFSTLTLIGFADQECV